MKNNSSSFFINRNVTSMIKKDALIGNPIYYFDEITSTFDKIKEFPLREGLTVVSKKQSKGRGRLGRNWSSEEGGVYFSFYLTPDTSPEEATFATIICALGTAKALQKYGNCSIKWPNDIVMNKKKICGILTTMGATADKLEYICVGIGINVNKDKFDEDLPYASSLKIETKKICDENQILCDVLESIEKIYTTYNSEKVISEYKKYCITIGNTIKVHYADGSENFSGKCIGIKKDGSLIVQKENKTITVNSGEVSVRGLYGYV